MNIIAPIIIDNTKSIIGFNTKLPIRNTIHDVLALNRNPTRFTNPIIGMIIPLKTNVGVTMIKHGKIKKFIKLIAK